MRHDYIDGLRGFAIIAVLAGHAAEFVGINNDLIHLHSRGVQLFFLISAFTLFNSSKQRFDSEAHPRRNFYIRRVFRIIPMWWIAISLYVLLGYAQFQKALPSYTMLFGFVRWNPALDVHPNGWSLFVEESFYLLLPIIFTQITGLRSALKLTAILFVVSWLWSWFGPWFSQPETNSFIFAHPLAQWVFFGGGVALYFVMQRGVQIRPVVLDLSVLVGLWLGVVADFRIAGVGLAAIFIAASNADTLTGKLARVKVIRRFGQCCYSIYLLHWIILLVIQHLNIPRIATLAPVAEFAVWFSAIMAISWIVGNTCYQWIEKPCINAGKALIVRLDQAPKSDPASAV